MDVGLQCPHRRRRMIKQTVLTLTICCLIGPFAASAGDHSNDLSNVIHATYNKWVETTNAKDIAQWSTFVAPDAVFFPPDGPALDSKEDIVGFYTKSFDDPNFVLECTQTFIEVADSNDFAWTRGTCKATFSLPDGSIGRGSSKWAKVWVLMEDGEWKCRLNAWNNNQ